MLSLIVKATGRCNSNCRYCLEPKQASGMSLATLGRLYDRVEEYVAAHAEHAELEWHGGEPLLVGVRFFEAALAQHRKHWGDDAKRVRYALQTNLTCLTDDFIPVLRAMGIRQVGTSYDPEPSVRGFGPDHDSDRYNRKFLAGVAVLERAGFGFALNYVVTKSSLRAPREVFTFLTNLGLAGSVSLNPLEPGDDPLDGLRTSPEEYASFLEALVPVWQANRARFPGVQPFDSLVAPASSAPRKPFHQVWVAPNGDLYQCRRAADGGQQLYGNVETTSFAAALKAMRERHEQGLRDNPLAPECLVCRFASACHSGGVPDAFSQNQRVFEKGPWCDARFSFLRKHFGGA
jgi:radical SAM protein with 4Fe4S-binding SPASM domain